MVYKVDVDVGEIDARNGDPKKNSRQRLAQMVQAAFRPQILAATPLVIMVMTTLIAVTIAIVAQNSK